MGSRRHSLNCTGAGPLALLIAPSVQQRSINTCRCLRYTGYVLPLGYVPWSWTAGRFKNIGGFARSCEALPQHASHVVVPSSSHPLSACLYESCRGLFTNSSRGGLFTNSSRWIPCQVRGCTSWALPSAHVRNLFFGVSQCVQTLRLCNNLAVCCMYLAWVLVRSSNGRPFLHAIPNLPLLDVSNVCLKRDYLQP